MLSTAGQSGSPVYRIHNKKAKLVAIHKGRNELNKINKVSTKISMKMIEQIEIWRKNQLKTIFDYEDFNC